MENLEAYLKPTAIIDSDEQQVLNYAMNVVGLLDDPIKKAIKLCHHVRDHIWYDPYSPFYKPEHYRASNVIKAGKGYCVSKASLLCALGRACNIPSRLGFANVKNHLATKELIERLGSTIFVYHGYTEFFLSGKWVKATPAFNSIICRRHHAEPLDFNGIEDSILQSFNFQKKQFMEYICFHDSYEDVPVDTILEAWKSAYGKERVEFWIEENEKADSKTLHDFSEEQVVQ